jgi:ABC-2 type transport system ATP-binding protein
MSEPAMIEVEHLVKRFGALTAVDGITFSVRRGEVLGFLGPNGAGKSTTMKMITGFLTPSAGRVRICGDDMATRPIAAKERLGYLPEGAPAYPDMTPRQFLKFIAAIRRAPKAAIDRAVALTELGAVLDQPIDTLSKGFKRRVGLAQAILHDPPVLIMDEPTDGLDPNQKHAVRGLLRSMAAEKAIVLSTHILEEVDAVCTRALIIDRGRIVADGTPEALLARSRYRNAVHLTVASTDAAAARTALAALPGVAAVEEMAAADGGTSFLVVPEGGRPLLLAVGELARAYNWQTRDLYAEPGRLDEVFRSLTAHEADRRAA